MIDWPCAARRRGVVSARCAWDAPDRLAPARTLLGVEWSGKRTVPVETPGQMSWTGRHQHGWRRKLEPRAASPLSD